MNDVVKYSVNLRFQSFRFVAIGPKEDRHCLRQTVEVYQVDEKMALFGYSYNLPYADALRSEHPYPEQWTQTVVNVATDIRIETLPLRGRFESGLPLRAATGRSFLFGGSPFWGSTDTD
jgi:hypothetical protein